MTAVAEGQHQIVVLLRGVVADIPAGAFGANKHQLIGGVEAIQLVAAKIAAEQEGIAVADALQDVIAAAADEGQVAAGMADQRVVAGVAEQPCVVAASLQEVIAVAAGGGSGIGFEARIRFQSGRGHLMIHLFVENQPEVSLLRRVLMSSASVMPPLASRR